MADTESSLCEPESFVSFDELYTTLRSLERQCESHAGFLALLGQLELASQRPEAALLNLERAVMLDPYNGAARVDYAEALYLTGNIQLALAVNAQLIGLGSLPPTLELELKKRQQIWSREPGELQPADRPQSQTIRQVMFDLGYSQNLNNGSVSQTVDLSLPDIVYTFELDDDLQAQAGAFARALYLQEADNAQLYASLSQSALGWRDRMAMGVVYKKVSALNWVEEEVYSGQLEFGEGELGLDSTIQLQLASPQFLSQGKLSVLAGYSGSTDANTSSVLVGGARYKRVWEGDNWRSTLGARSQYEFAVSPRPGGDFISAGVTVGASVGLGPGSLSITQEVGYARSAEGYSALLSDGEELRNIKKTQALTYTFPVNSAMWFSLSAQKLATSSNLDIFKRDHSEYMARLVVLLD